VSLPEGDGHHLPDATLVQFKVGEDDMTDGVVVAPSLPRRLRYQVEAHWLGNVPGRSDYHIVGTSPSGVELVSPCSVEIKKFNDKKAHTQWNNTLFFEYGQYQLQIVVGSKPIAETHFSIVPSRPDLPCFVSDYLGRNTMANVNV